MCNLAIKLRVNDYHRAYFPSVKSSSTPPPPKKAFTIHQLFTLVAPLSRSSRDTHLLNVQMVSLMMTAWRVYIERCQALSTLHLVKHRFSFLLSYRDHIRNVTLNIVLIYVIFTAYAGKGTEISIAFSG